MFKLTQLGNIGVWLRVAYEVAVSHIVYRSLDQATMESCVRLHKALESYVRVHISKMELVFCVLFTPIPPGNKSIALS